MKKQPQWAWRTMAQLFALLVSMAVGIIFRIWGSNPFLLFGENNPNVSFLWISAMAYFVAAILSYTLWPLVRAEMTKKDKPINQEQPPPWYENEKMVRASRLVYRVFWPNLCILQILLIVEIISHLELLIWLAGLALLITIVAATVGLVWMGQAYFRRTKRSAQEREMEQPASM